jgi:nucleoid DNA-binding protein/cell division septation protein DedD
MEEYIRKYLLEHEKSIINGFGVFEIVYKSAEIHPVLHTFTAPGKYVVFSENPLADSNDLAKWISVNTNTTQEQAADDITKWVKKVKDTLSYKKEYTLSALGKFVTNAMGKIEFISLQDETISPETFGLENFTVTLPTSKQTASTVQNEDKKEDEKTISPVAEKSIAENKQEESPDEEDDDDISEELIDGFSPVNTRKYKPKRILALFVLFLLLCCVLGIGITYILYPEAMESYVEHVHLLSFMQKKDGQKQQQLDTVATKHAISQENRSSEDSPILEGAVTETISASEQPSTVAIDKSQNETQQTNYYIVLGSFQSKDNAQAYLQKKRTEYKNAVDLGQGQYSNLYMIGIGPLTKSEAELQLQQGINGWLFKK